MRSKVRCALFPVYKADDRGKFDTVWGERVARALQSSGLRSTPYMAMSVHGPARTGKSSLMCHMASWLVKLPGTGSAEPPAGENGEARPSLAPLWEGATVPEWSECQWTGETVPKAFKASNLDIPCTAGVDAFACLLPAGTLGRATDLLVLLFDCEGRGDKDTTHDLRVTLPALAASSNGLLIFNTMNPPQPHSVLSSMEEFVDAAELIGMHMANADRVKPTFVNLTRDSAIRDFAVDADGNPGPADVHYEPARPDSNRGGWHQGRPHRSAVEQRVLEKEAVDPTGGEGDCSDDDSLGPEEEDEDGAASSAPASGASKRNRMRSRLHRACHDVQIVRLGASKTTLPAQMRASFAAMLGNRIKAAGTQNDKVFGLDAYPMVGGKLLQVLSDVVESSNAVQDPRKGWLASWLSHTLKQIERAGREYSDHVQRKAFDQTISRDCPLGCTRGIGRAVGQLMKERIRETVEMKAKEVWAESMFDSPSARDGLTAVLDKLTGAKCGPALVAHALDERAEDDRKHLLASTQSAAVLAFEQVWQRHCHVAVSGRRIPDLQQCILQARQATEQASCMRFAADGSAKSDDDVMKEFRAAHDSAKTVVYAAKDALEQDATARRQAMRTAQRFVQSQLVGSLRDIKLTCSGRDVQLQDGTEGDEAVAGTVADRTERLAHMGAMQLLDRMQPCATTGAASSPPAETGPEEAGASNHGSAADPSGGERGPASGAGAPDPPGHAAEGHEHDGGVGSSSAEPEPIGASSSDESNDEGNMPLPRLAYLWGCCQANVVLCGFRPAALALAVSETGKNPRLATFMRDLETSSTKYRSIQLEMLSQLSQQLQSSRLHMSGAHESRARLHSMREEFEKTKLEVEETEKQHKEQIKRNQDYLKALEEQRQKDKVALDQQLQQAERDVQDMIDRLNRGTSLFGAVLSVVSAGLTIGSAFLTGGASVAMGGMGAFYGWASKKVDE